MVAIHLPRWRQCLLGLWLLRLVLPHQATHPRLRFRPPLLQLQLPRLHRLWPPYRHGGLSNGVRVCAPHLWVCTFPLSPFLLFSRIWSRVEFRAHAGWWVSLANSEWFAVRSKLINVIQRGGMGGIKGLVGKGPG